MRNKLKFAKKFPFKDNEAFFLLYPTDFHSHESCVKLIRKISCEIGDVAECGSQIEIEFHERSQIKTSLSEQNHVMQARNYLDFN